MSQEQKFRFESRISRGDGCWIWTGTVFGTDGYGAFSIRRETYQAHRLSYKHFKGVDPETLWVCHSCDNRICVNPDHLWTGTVLENTQDAVNKKRNAFGAKQGLARLTDRDVIYIRKMIEAGIPYSEISRLYDISKPAVGHIAIRRTWKHLA